MKKLARFKNHYYLCSRIHKHAIYYETHSILLVKHILAPAYRYTIYGSVYIGMPDSLQRIENKLLEQSNQYLSQQDSIYRVIGQCKTDQERKVQHEVLKKVESKLHNNAKQIDKVRHDQEVERARLEHIES